MRHTTFGQDANGDPITLELGANWVQGLGTAGGPENPIWLLVCFNDFTGNLGYITHIITNY